jgi:MFS transporter, ACS family, pantothenate transporter
MNNVGTRLMKTTLNDWPPGTPDYVNHIVLETYIQETSLKTGVDLLTIYGAQVIELRKEGVNWVVRFSTLRKDLLNGKVEEQKRSLVSAVKPIGIVFADEFQKFNAVVVASGHYHSPRVPDIPGLKELKKRYPSRVFHSKAYRRPDEFRDKVSPKSS